MNARDEIGELAQSVADALRVPIGHDIRVITNALLEIQQKSYERAVRIVQRETDPIDKIRALANEAAQAKV